MQILSKGLPSEAGTTGTGAVLGTAGSTVSGLLAVRFSNAQYPSGDGMSAIWMGAHHAPYGAWQAATVALPKAGAELTGSQRDYSAALLWEMKCWGCGFEAYNRRHVASSTPVGIGPLVLYHLPPLTAAANSLGVRIRLFGAGDP